MVGVVGVSFPLRSPGYPWIPFLYYFGASEDPLWAVRRQDPSEHVGQRGYETEICRHAGGVPRDLCTPAGNAP